MTEVTPDVPQGMQLLGAWIDKTFRAWKAHWRLWTAIGGLYFAVQAGAAILLGRALGNPYFPRQSDWTQEEIAIYIPLVALIVLILRALFEPVMVMLALAQMREETPSAGTLLRAAERLLIPALVLFLLVSLLYLLGLLVFVIGLLYAAVSLYLVLPILVDQKTGPLNAIRLSWLATNRNFFFFFFFSGFFWLLGFASTVLQQPFLIERSPAGLLWSLFIGAIIIPWILIAQAAAYDEVFRGGEAGGAEAAAPEQE